MFLFDIWMVVKPELLVTLKILQKEKLKFAALWREQGGGSGIAKILFSRRCHLDHQVYAGSLISLPKMEITYNDRKPLDFLQPHLPLLIFPQTSMSL